MNQFLNNLKRQAEENPLVAVGIGAGALNALNKLLATRTQSKNSKAWAKEVDRRVKKSSSK